MARSSVLAKNVRNPQSTKILHKSILINVLMSYSAVRHLEYGTSKTNKNEALKNLAPVETS